MKEIREVSSNLGFAGQLLKILFDLLLRWVVAGNAVLPGTKWGKGKALDVIRPGRLGDRAVEIGPQTEGHHRKGNDDQQNCKDSGTTH